MKPIYKNPNYKKEWYIKNKDRIIQKRKETQYCKKYYTIHKKEMIDYIQKRRITNPEIRRNWYIKNKDKINRYSREYKLKIKKDLFLKILNHYGNKCACCGENNEFLLTIDHVNNDGHDHRKKNHKYIIQIWRDIINEGFPNKYQILCHNCNWGKSRFGQCPHKTNFSLH